MPSKSPKKKPVHVRMTEDEVASALACEESKNRIIEMAWEDRTPFDAIFIQFGLSESNVKVLMKKELKFSSYKLWRERVEACKTKHLAKRNQEIDRFKSSMQKFISGNKISKR